MISKSREVPTNIEMLTSLLIGNGSYGHTAASVQRSHRFPLHLFIQMENMARISKAPVSLIINLLLECGLDSVKEKLPEDVLGQVSRTTQAQLDRPTVADRVEVKQRSSESKKGRKRER